MHLRYKIYRLSAKIILSYAKETEAGVYSFDLTNNATERCKIFTANHEQEDNALFFQIMSVLHQDKFTQPKDTAMHWRDCPPPFLRRNSVRSRP